MLSVVTDKDTQVSMLDVAGVKGVDLLVNVDDEDGSWFAEGSSSVVV